MGLLAARWSQQASGRPVVQPAHKAGPLKAQAKSGGTGKWNGQDAYADVEADKKAIGGVKAGSMQEEG